MVKYDQGDNGTNRPGESNNDKFGLGDIDTTGLLDNVVRQFQRCSDNNDIIIKDVIIFGSVARGDAIKNESDIDILLVVKNLEGNNLDKGLDMAMRNIMVCLEENNEPIITYRNREFIDGVDITYTIPRNLEQQLDLKLTQGGRAVGLKSNNTWGESNIGHRNKEEIISDSTLKEIESKVKEKTFVDEVYETTLQDGLESDELVVHASGTDTPDGGHPIGSGIIISFGENSDGTISGLVRIVMHDIKGLREMAEDMADANNGSVRFGPTHVETFSDFIAAHIFTDNVRSRDVAITMAENGLSILKESIKESPDKYIG